MRRGTGADETSLYYRTITDDGMAYRGGVDDSRRGVMSMTGTGVTALQPLRPGSATAAVPSCSHCDLGPPPPPYRPAAAATWVRHRRRRAPGGAHRRGRRRVTSPRRSKAREPRRQGGQLRTQLQHWVGSRCILPTRKIFPTYIQSTEQTKRYRPTVVPV